MGPRFYLCGADLGRHGLSGDASFEILARHVSPDGRLTWRVERYREADGVNGYAAGFEDSFWHIHPDQLQRAGEDEEKLRGLTADLLADRLVVVVEVWTPPGTEAEDQNIRILGDLETEIDFKSNDEKWQLRFWSGAAVEIDDLIDGKVAFLPLDQKLLVDD
ncbi:MAG: hypothetical protein EOP22_04620 [Hyphomicrobiales bacterium]|nr:MAG: hypothetical protein EOP22_04620 [Hyphomicrobiales bacterium]